jgi:hypothetical protein
MIETFMRHGLRWQHVDRPTFLFRLAACGQGLFSHQEAQKAQR